MTRFDRITVEEHIANGQPCIRNTKITVRRVLQAMATYPCHEDLLREYPVLEEEDLRQAFEFAADSLNIYFDYHLSELPAA